MKTLRACLIRPLSLLFLVLIYATACNTVSTGSKSSTPGEPAQPSKQETVDFLLNRLNDQWNPQLISTVGYYDATVSVTLNECELSVTHRRQPGSLTEKKFHWVVPLGKLDPEQIEVRVLSGDAVALGKERTIVIKTINSEPAVTLNGSIKKDRLEVVIRPEGEDAYRVTKALKHLITLCGGKKSAF